jgi:hypothetical protein
MTDADLDKLEALAKAATPGPWNDSGGSIDDFDAECTMRIEWIANGIPKDGEKDAINANYRFDAAFIAAANPASILALIASARRDAEEIERLRARLTEQQADTAFLLARAGHAGSCSFAPGRWTGMSSNAIVSVAFGGEQTALPSDMSDYLACVRTFRRLPRHRRTPTVRAALKRARDAYTARYPRRVRAARGRGDG